LTRLGIALSLLFLPAVCAGADELEGKTISAVNISGLERVSEQVVRAKLEVQPGQTMNPRAVGRDIRRLYELGHFTSIKAEMVPDNGKAALTYIVEEKRVVDEVRIIGNKKIKLRKIRGVIKLREGESFLPDIYEEERDAILKLYESKGYANASVDLIVETVGPSRVRVTYNIHEDKKARISKILFSGNQNVKTRKLKKIMKTHRAFWFIGGKFEEEKFETDIDNILDEYGNRGHLEAEIPVTDIEFTPNGKHMRIRVNISEGPVYHVETLEVANNEVYDNDEIGKIIEVHPGDVHNKGQVVKDADLVTEGYQDSGYVDAQDTPQVTLDREKKTTHIVHNLAEGDLKYIREIKIMGNEVTRDEVIRREMMLRPGDRYDGAMVKASKRRLDNTQYFDETRLTLADIEDNELFKDMVVDVKEGKTGSFNFGAGYSTEEGIGGFTELHLSNFDVSNWPKFSGAGQDLSIKLNVGQVHNNYNISFTEPEFLGYPLAVGADIFNDSYRVRNGAGYTENELGGQIRVGKQLSPYVTARASLRVSQENLSGFDDSWFLHEDIKRQQEDALTISTTWQIERNTLDNNRDPSSGSRHLLSTEIAGFGGTYNYWKVEHDSTWYKAFGESRKWVLSLRLREGFVTPYLDSKFVPLQNRLFAGGATTVRGYDFRDIGPKTREYILWYWGHKITWGSKFSQGGNVRGVGNLELKYKITKAVRLYAFFDAGGVWEYFKDIKPGDIKCSVGLGLGVDVPRIGPIRVDYGFALNPDEDQGRGRLHLMTGFRF